MKKITVADVLRSICAYIIALMFFVPFTIVAYPVHWLIWLFNRRAAESYAYHVVKGALIIVTFICGVKVEKIGTENTPKEAALYVSNHRSFFDMITVYPAIKGRLGFVAKKNFKKAFPLAIWMKAAGSLFLDRENPRKGMATIKESAEWIKDGRNMFICPEGTRNHNDECLPFREGAFKIAEKAGCPAVPVTFIGTDDAFERAHMPLVSAVNMKIVFGKPVMLAGLSREEYKEACKAIEAEINETYKKYAVKE